MVINHHKLFSSLHNNLVFKALIIDDSSDGLSIIGSSIGCSFIELQIFHSQKVIRKKFQNTYLS
jgi:hypothetical protein